MHRYDLRRLAGDDLLDVIGPELQRDAPLVEIVVSLVDSDDPPERAAAMIQRCLDYFDPHAEPLHSRRGASPKVVQGPRNSRLHCPIEVALQPAESTDRAASVVSEDEITADEAGLCCNDCPCLRCERHGVCLAVLDPL